MAPISAELLERFMHCVYERSDLHFSAKKQPFFEKRLGERFERSGLPDYETYYGFLMENPTEVYALVEDLTTNETYFFRNNSQFRALSEEVVPSLVESKNREVVSTWGKGLATRPGRHPAMNIRMWSAGCSTGEEAYSIAFSLLSTVKYPKAWGLEVLATDIKRETLAIARRGVYADGRLKGMNRAIRDRFMEKTESGWSVRPDPRMIVSFFAANIKDITNRQGRRTLGLADESGGVQDLDVQERFDVVFCRNVMIYFDRSAQQRLVDALYDCIRPGGYLFTGDSEPLHLFTHGFVRAQNSDALYYRKPE